MANWPDDLKQQVDGLTVLVSGGYRFDGVLITPLDEQEIRAVIRRALALDIRSFCVCGVFSPSRSDQEERVAELIREESADVYITLSHEVAGLGLSERENAAILNACLRPLAEHTMKGLKQALPAGLPLFLTRNDGTLLSAERCAHLPVLTFVSGPTNSMVGAVHLTGIQNGIVVDIGGTSTDIGVIINGRPRHRHTNVQLVDGIRVNMSMPDVLSLPLGGGTVIHVDEDGRKTRVGPDSVGYKLTTEALAFGGQVMTGTDVALAAGLVSGIIRPPHFEVCNAIGAALCAVSGTVESIVDLIPTSVDGGIQRNCELDRLKLAAYEQCVRNGAHRNTIRLVEMEQVPLAYHPDGHKHRVLITAIGELNLSELEQYHEEDREQRLVSEVKLGVPQNIQPPIYIDMTNKRPVFDENGAWIIDSIDIEYIAYGAGILDYLWTIDHVSGCGGGGESYRNKLASLEVLRRNHGKMRVIPPSSLDPSTDLAVGVGFMGAPTVGAEYVHNGKECLQAVKAIEAHLACSITAVFSNEIGGSNAFIGLMVAAKKNVPCIDCDGMGRAFPRLDHVLSVIRGQRVTPTSLCDVHGHTILCTSDKATNGQELENFLREECTKMGLTGGICDPPMTGEEVQQYTIHHSLSRAWFLGEAKFNNRTDVIQAVVRAGHGRILLSNGKVSNVERNTGAGFVRGHLTIETTEGQILTIDFQNENLIARFGEKEVIASVPDLITLVEQESGDPLSTETVKYGCRVSVLVLPAPEPMITSEALRSVGPKAFGYDYQYTPITNQSPIRSVWDVYYKKS
ncbi:unnamed protein product [Rotaria sordida]|uniref:Hydantoinase n=1 Tax=Rotaria sordida TaxID=392033 RepID=A0A819BMF4_9BILA|nr:unnamed protein product [Rotaria sordida]CAF0976456.1 unnamed protein product [Rotaria sordida]CAF3793909.1 unnamed protein product [Rotaria sordida]CAF3804372.1 unnamed protein product [Rotaria sordida]